MNNKLKIGDVVFFDNIGSIYLITDIIEEKLTCIEYNDFLTITKQMLKINISYLKSKIYIMDNDVIPKYVIKDRQRIIRQQKISKISGI